MQSLSKIRFQQFNRKHVLAISLALILLTTILLWVIFHGANKTEINSEQLRSDSYKLYQKGDYKMAAEKLESYMKIEPKDAKALEMLASTYTLISDKEKAIEKTKELLEFHPNEPDILYRLGLYSAELKRNNDAISYLNSAITYKKDLFQARRALAKIYCDEKKYNLALEQLEKCLSSTTNNTKYQAIIYAEMGDIYRQKKDLDKANEMYKQGLAKDPTNKDIEKRLAKTTQ